MINIKPNACFNSFRLFIAVLLSQFIVIAPNLLNDNQSAAQQRIFGSWRE